MSTDMINTKDAIKEEYFAEYNVWLDTIYKQILTLDINVFLLKKVFQYPFRLFPITNHNYFFEYFIRNTIDICIVTIAKLVTDQGEGVMTVRKFKRKLMKEILKNEFQEDFRKVLRKAKWDIRIENLFDKVRDFRNDICHILPEPLRISIKFQDIFELVEELKKLLDILSFDKEMLTLYVPYYAQLQNQDSRRTDIDIIFDCVAQNSVDLNLPETNPQHWEAYKKNITQDDKEIYDDYRKKFSLPTQFS
ncbi:MAG: hypothetical protein HQ574_07505 [Chloroflexi bacterium]|nr:hypothetical protein [Chloroflexota bacterium]